VTSGQKWLRQQQHFPIMMPLYTFKIPYGEPRMSHEEIAASLLFPPAQESDWLDIPVAMRAASTGIDRNSNNQPAGTKAVTMTSCNESSNQLRQGKSTWQGQKATAALE